MDSCLRLGVNIDHVATVRNARGGIHPDPVAAAHLAVQSGADGITAHLREDRRHIKDSDIVRLIEELDAPLNLEMAATEEMVNIATRHKPNAACIVPEKRKEVTTEGGLDVIREKNRLGEFTKRLLGAGCRVSLFVDPDLRQLDAALALGVPVVELHTGQYCESNGYKRASELSRIRIAASYCEQIGLECHAGHGLNFDTVESIATISPIAELNIGHFLVGEAIFIGFPAAIKRMRDLMVMARIGI